jgi:hypothetical protein
VLGHVNDPALAEASLDRFVVVPSQELQEFHGIGNIARPMQLDWDNE